MLKKMLWTRSPPDEVVQTLETGGTPPTVTPTPEGSDKTQEASKTSDAPADTTKASETADPNAAKTTEEVEDKLDADPFAEQEDKSKGSDYLGAPEDGKYTYTLPDGFAPDEAAAMEYSKVAQELGLSNKGAQKMLDHYLEVKQKEARAWDQHLISLDKAAKADPDIGGAKYPEAVRQAKSALAKFAPKDFVTSMSKYGVTRHPAFIKAWAAVGAALGETSLPGLGTQSGTGGEPMLHDLMYKDTK